MTKAEKETLPPVRIGELLAGKYRVERVLGEGGMGMVVAATHIQLDQRVAIKCLLPDAAANKTAVDRFAREARACAKLRGDHVVRVTDVGTLDSGTPFMVMEYLEGEDLGDHLQKVGRLEVDEAVDLILQACAGLAEAHAAGIVHRDLKPANLFLANRADVGRVLKVVDFGISKLVDVALAENLTTTRDLMGSPLYMSPEQLRSQQDVDARTDIWAVGVILYELLAGEPPFRGDTLPQVCSAVMVNEPPPLESKRAGLPPALAPVVLKCLAKEPDRRYASVSELAEALAPFAPARSSEALARVARLAASGVGAHAETTPNPIAVERKVDVNAETALADISATRAPQKTSRAKPLWVVAIVALLGALAFVAMRSPSAPVMVVTPVMSVPTLVSPSVSITVAPSASSSAPIAKRKVHKKPAPAPSTSAMPSASASAAEVEDEEPSAPLPTPSAQPSSQASAPASVQPLPLPPAIPTMTGEPTPP